MGRWLNKIGNIPESVLTKPTKPSSVSFVSPTLEHFQKNNLDNLGVVGFVIKCCRGFKIDPDQVIDHLLSMDDEQDIANGDISDMSLRLFIELWLNAGMPHISGKPD